eukprot:CAMPEP_0114991960 /NCGR_PEP_ID=MMETSP0216-20121206/11671_1 /TAXON_ID=223996 /ORGANISM="Protocruzia adherens, Strain Boccale" /LENGTH=100 /DNA_ID=CAMNT_0002355363 /DNA_START=32 /DNA_END=334 /DNA_ORIENTATION=-
MGYYENWDEFLQVSTNLMLEDPIKTRMQLKYRNKEPKAIFTVTNSEKCYKFKTDRDSALKYIEKINGIFFNVMANMTETEESKTEESKTAKKKNKQKRRG